MSSGIYLVKLVQTGLGQTVIVMVESIGILDAAISPAQLAVESAQLGPNPLEGAAARDPHARLVLAYLPGSQGQGVALLYTMAGEMVSEANDSGSGHLEIPVGQCAAGIYLVDFELRTGSSVLARTVIKVAILK